MELLNTWFTADGLIAITAWLLLLLPLLLWPGNDLLPVPRAAGTSWLCFPS
jgi:hypothetical protein